MAVQRIYLEIGTRRTFAGGVEWPGWARSGRDADEAVARLIEYAPRYASAIGAAVAFQASASVDDTEIVERLDGDSSTDFGVPHAAPAGDDAPMDAAELARQSAILTACWKTFDAVMERHAGVELRKGPRGGGRDQAKIAGHVFEAEAAYLHQLGGRYPGRDDADPATEMPELRRRELEALAVRAEGGTIEGGSRVRKPWSPRYFVRRAAWHVLDHAWEIEDRAAAR